MLIDCDFAMAAKKGSRSKIKGPGKRSRLRFGRAQHRSAQRSFSAPVL
jgi:hypothetical protein